MSQIFRSSTSGPVPPTVATSYVTDSGTAVPAANILIIHGVDSTENNANGVIAKGGVIGTGTANEVDLVLTNRLQGTGSTAGAVTADLVTFSLGAIPGTYTFDCRIAGFNSSTPAGVGYAIVGSVRTDGATATLITNQAVDHFEEAATVPCFGQIVVSGNNAVIRVTGAAGLNINWNAVGEYVFVS